MIDLERKNKVSYKCNGTDGVNGTTNVPMSVLRLLVE